MIKCSEFNPQSLQPDTYLEIGFGRGPWVPGVGGYNAYLGMKCNPKIMHKTEFQEILNTSVTAEPLSSMYIMQEVLCKEYFHKVYHELYKTYQTISLGTEPQTTQHTQM